MDTGTTTLSITTLHLTTLSLITLNLAALNLTTLNLTTLNLTTQCIATLRINIRNVISSMNDTIHLNTQYQVSLYTILNDTFSHCYAVCRYAGCCYAECRGDVDTSIIIRISSSSYKTFCSKFKKILAS